MKFLKKSSRKKIDDNFTFIVLPGNTGKAIHLGFTRRHLWAGAALLSGAVLLSVLVSCLFFHSQAEIRSVETIKRESLRKDETIEIMGQEIQAMRKQQENIIEKQNEIKKLMGIRPDMDREKPSRGVVAGGIGGAETDANDILEITRNLKREGNRQEEELERLFSEVAQRKSYYRSRPNLWPITGEISSPYGWRRSPFNRNKKSFHNGIDIIDAVGTEVLAAGDGQVIYAGWKAVYGKTVEIDHGHGFITCYGHNSAILVNKGDRVAKGEAIARLGNTGNSTGPHLHFSILKDEESVNPEYYLP